MTALFFISITTTRVSALTNITSCASTQSTSNEEYNLNKSLNCVAQTGITFSAVRNITLDCKGFSINSNLYAIQTGISSTTNESFTIKNCIVTNFSIGFNFAPAGGNINNLTFVNNTIFQFNSTQTSGAGIQIRNATNVNITGNIFNGSKVGLLVNVLAAVNTNLWNYTIDNNLFENNIADISDLGTSLPKIRGYIKITNNLFNAGSLRNSTNILNLNRPINNLYFENNTILNTIYSSSAISLVNVTNSTFINNNVGNSGFYVNGSGASNVVSIFKIVNADNLTFEGNKMYLHSIGGLNLYTSGNMSKDIRINNNYVNFNSLRVDYGITCGSDTGGVAGDIVNCNMSNNYVTAIKDTAGRHAHIMKNAVDSYITNVTTIGAYYCFVFKNNNRVFVDGVTCLNTAVGWHDKGSKNSIINHLFSYNSSSYALYFYSDNSINRGTENETYTNSILQLNESGSYVVYGLGNVTAKLLNVTYDLATPATQNESLSENVTLTRSWIIDVFVKNSTGEGIGGASIILNSSNNKTFITSSTQGTGYLGETELTGYIINSTLKDDYNNYTFYVNKTGFISASGNLGFVSNGAQNVTLNIDTTAPRVNLNAPTNGSTAGSRVVSFASNFTDEIDLLNATLFVWNSTGGLINSTENRTISGTSNSSNISVVLPYDGMFLWNYFVVDSSGNYDWNATNWTLTVDTNVPYIELLNPGTGVSYSATSKLVTFQYNVSENVSYCNLTVNSTIVNSSLSGAGFANYVVNVSSEAVNSFSNLFYVGSYSWNVTCFDNAGNTNTSSTRMFSVVAPVADDSENTGGGGGGISRAKEIIITSSQLNLGYSNLLAPGEKIKFNVTRGTTNETHSILVNSVSNTSVSLTLASIPQTFSLLLGDSRKFSLINPEYYDLRITLVSISGAKAQIKVQKTDEKIVQNNATNNAGTNSSGNISMTGTGGSGDVRTGVQIFIIVALIVVLIFVPFVILFWIKRQKAERGF